MAKTESNGLLSFRSDVNILVLGEGDREYSFKFFIAERVDVLKLANKFP